MASGLKLASRKAVQIVGGIGNGEPVLGHEGVDEGLAAQGGQGGGVVGAAGRITASVMLRRLRT